MPSFKRFWHAIVRKPKAISNFNHDENPIVDSAIDSMIDSTKAYTKGPAKNFAGDSNRDSTEDFHCKYPTAEKARLCHRCKHWFENYSFLLCRSDVYRDSPSYKNITDKEVKAAIDRADETMGSTLWITYGYFNRYKPTDCAMCQMINDYTNFAIAHGVPIHGNWNHRTPASLFVHLAIRVCDWIEETVASSVASKACGPILSTDEGRSLRYLEKQVVTDDERISFQIGHDFKFWRLATKESNEAYYSLLHHAELSEDAFGLPRFKQRLCDFRLFRRWLQICEKSHSRCKRTIPTRSGVLRLIDVQTKRLVEIDSETMPEYCALSYTWGGTNWPKLTRATFAAAKETGFTLSEEFHPAVTQAFEVVERLHLRYLWVDSLCIIQDDDLDKAQEIDRMDVIYSAASLTIIAASCIPGDLNLRGVNERAPRGQPSVLFVDGMSLISRERDPLSDVWETKSPWVTRAWTLQEYLLSKRCLVFSDDQVTWVCTEARWCEDTHLEHPRFAHPEHNRYERHGIIPSVFYDADREKTATLFPRLIELFSRKKLTDPQDRISASTGMINIVSRNLGGEQFFWGTPESSLEIFVRWKLDPQMGYEQRVLEYPSLAEHFASWSWLSADAPVTFAHGMGNQDFSLHFEPAIEVYRQVMHATDGIKWQKCSSYKLVEKPTLGGIFDVDYGLKKHGSFHCPSTIDIEIVKKHCPAAVSLDKRLGARCILFWASVCKVCIDWSSMTKEGYVRLHEPDEDTPAIVYDHNTLLTRHLMSEEFMQEMNDLTNATSARMALTDDFSSLDARSDDEDVVEAPEAADNDEYSMYSSKPNAYHRQLAEDQGNVWFSPQQGLEIDLMLSDTTLREPPYMGDYDRSEREQESATGWKHLRMNSISSDLDRTAHTYEITMIAVRTSARYDDGSSEWSEAAIWFLQYRDSVAYRVADAEIDFGDWKKMKWDKRLLAVA